MARVSPEVMEPRKRSFWTWNLGRIAGIPIRVHLTLLLLLVWIAVTYALEGAGWSPTAIGVILIIAIFATILVHELGHALVARAFGISTRDILLLPIGGISSLERMPSRPAQELAVAIVGPAINLVLAGLLWVGITLAGGTTRFGAATTLGGAFVTQLMWINVGLAIFNLIPAFPMDGGRVLRAVLAFRLDRERATDVAAACGKVCAVAFALIGLYANLWLVLIAAFVWFGASQERALVHLQAALAGVPVRAAMVTRVDAVTSEERLDATASILVADGVDSLPVIDHGRPVGAITREDIAAGLARGGPDATVGEAPHHEVITVTPNEPLDGLFERLQTSPGTVALVIDHGTAIGTITAEHLARYVALHELQR